MADEVDFYKVLGIDKNASEDEIKKSFRRFSKKYHPDMQHGKTDAEKKEAEEKFKQGQAAYECLSDPEKRKIYDQYGIDGLSGHAQQGGFPGGMSSGLADFIRKHMQHFGFDPFNDFNPFGENKQEEERRAPSNTDPEDGQSYRIRMQVDLEDVIFGTEKEFTMDGFNICPDCHGHKCEGYEECPNCHGAGMTQRIQGNMIFRSTCPVCSGNGYSAKNICKTCGGLGRVKGKRQYKVKIPKGLPEGAQLRIRGGGVPGINGGEDGSLFIVVETKEHPIFKRVSNLDLEIDLFVNPLTTVYGGDVSIPTPYEMNTTHLFAGMKNGQTFKLKGQGIRKSETEKGDLIVKLVFDTIDSNQLDKETDEALRKAVMLLNKTGNKCLSGAKEQKKKLDDETKLPWILKM